MPSPGAYMRSPRNEPIGNRDPISSFGLGSHVGFSTKRNCKVNGDTRTSTSKKPKPGTPRHMELGVMFGTARECVKDAAILVTSLLQFQLEGFAPQIKKASRLRKTMDGQTTTFSGVDRNSGMGGRLSMSNKYKFLK